MYRNTPGTIKLFAFYLATNAPATGIENLITCQVSVDNGTLVATSDTNPDEIDNGFYVLNVLASENNGTTVDFYPECSNPAVQVIVVEHNRYTITPLQLTPEAFANIDPGILEQNTFLYFPEETRNYTISLASGVYDGQPMEFILNDEDGYTLTVVSPLTSTTNSVIVSLGPITLQTKKCGSWSLRRISDGYIWLYGPAVQKYVATERYPPP